METLIQSTAKFLGLPVGASTHAPTIDATIIYTHWLMFALFIGWGAFFVFVLWRFSKARNPKANPKGAQTHASTYFELLVAAIEVVLLLGFSIPFWIQRVSAFPAESEAIVVRVVAEQFAWNVHYPGKDGIFGKTDPKLVDAATNPLGLDRTDPNAKDDVTTINRLHLPVNKKVIVRLTAKDVIHSFGVPYLRVKQDIIPGMEIPVWFEPTQPGEYEIACSQLCGLGHYRMKGFVNVHTAEEYDAWMAEQEKAAAANAAAGGGDNFWQ